MMITTISTETILASIDPSWTNLESPFELGPLDALVSPTIPIAVVFLYQSVNPGGAPVLQLERLRLALAQVLDYYPHFTGRLKVDADGGVPSVVKLGAGAELVIAECDQKLDSFAPGGRTTITMNDLPSGGNTLLPPCEPTDELIHTFPIVSIQHTRFACGGVSLGIRILHTVCDAEGYFHFVTDLAEMYRQTRDGVDGAARLSDEPSIRPYLPDLASEQDRGVAITSLYRSEREAVEPAVQEGTPSPLSTEDQPTHLTTGQFIHFSAQEICAIKNEATEPTGQLWISSFDALSAHLYHHIHRARLTLRSNDPAVGALSPPDFLTPVNLRGRVGPPAFPTKYVGNALVTAVGEIQAEVLTNGPLWRIASNIHDLTRTPAFTSQTSLTETVRWIAAQPDKRKIVQDFRFGNGIFMCSQWTKFDLYEGASFDERPVLVAPPFTSISLIDGLGYLLPTSGGDGVEVCLALDQRLWPLLEQDNQFRRFQ